MSIEILDFYHKNICWELYNQYDNRSTKFSILNDVTLSVKSRNFITVTERSFSVLEKYSNEDHDHDYYYGGQLKYVLDIGK